VSRSAVQLSMAIVVCALAGTWILQRGAAHESPPLSSCSGLEAPSHVEHPPEAVHAPVSSGDASVRDVARTQVASADAETLTVDCLVKEDADRLLAVNAALRQAALAPIDPASRIRRSDLIVLRTIVDDSEKVVAKAEDRWLDAATAATAPLVKSLHEKLERGDSADLPIMSRDNSMRRRHPHEAITQVLFGNKYYVVRVMPQDNESLATVGSQMDAESTRRAFDYDNLIRGLFLR
jgi:hypothetical protein